MTHNIYIYILIMGGYLLFHPRTADDLDPKTFEEPVSSVLSILCTLCHTSSDDIPGNPSCHTVSNLRSPRSRCWSCGRMVRCRTAASRSSLLRSCIYCRAFFINFVI